MYIDEDTGNDDNIKNKLILAYDKFRQQLIDAKRKNEESNNFWLKEGREDIIRYEEFGYVDEWNYFNFRDFETFLKIYKPCIFNGLFRDELVDIAIFNHSMNNINSFYFPAMSGCQCGNQIASQKLYKESLKIVNKKLLNIKICNIKDKLWYMKYIIKKFFYKILKGNYAKKRNK
jgi:hypothetical protein